MAGQDVAITPSQMFRAEEPPYSQLVDGHAIRLIHLEPGVANEKVTIRLSTHKLEDTGIPAYDAISYVWGDENERESITCRGQELTITRSLESAFKRIRLPDRTRTMWADALCINQGDPREKSHHVAFMDKVYSHAKNVLICIGHATEETTAHISALLSEHQTRKDSYRSVADMPILPDHDPVFDDQRWKALADLMTRPWFSRAWVIQEAGVAENPVILLGDKNLSYRQLMQLARWIIRCASQLQTKFSISLLTIHTDWEQWSAGWETRQAYPYTIVDLLSHAKGLGCKDERDHIYAFLGHPLFQKPGGNGPFLLPDYTSSVADVYRRLTEWMLENVGLATFSAVEHDDKTIQDNMPSWVARWDLDVIQNSFGYYRPFYYQASGRDLTSTETQFTIQGQSCIVNALQLDSIFHLYRFSKEFDYWDVAEAAIALRKYSALADKLNDIYNDVFNPTLPCRYTSSERSDALSLTLCAGSTNYEQAEKNLALHRVDRDQFWSLLGKHAATLEADIAGQSVGEAKDRPVGTSGSADRYFYDLSLACKGRCFFVTKSGYYGVGPWIMRANDVCVVLKGARVPFLLRSATNEDKQPKLYNVLGEAYVHGIMNGELVRELHDVNWQNVSLV